MPQFNRGPQTGWNQIQDSGKPFVLVTPNGPDDGGDFGGNTPGTTTGGVNEAINTLRYNPVTGSGGGVVKIHGIVTLPTNSTGIVLYPGIGLVGDGPLDAFNWNNGTGGGTSFISVNANMPNPAITVEVDPNITGLTTFPYLADLGISGFGGSQTGQHGIYVNEVNGTVNDFYMSHILVFDMGGDGLNINNGGKHYFYDCYMEDNIGNGVHVINGFLQKISRCYVFGNQGTAGIYLDQSTTNSGYTEVDNCEVWNNYNDGVRSYPGGAGNYARIINNHFENNSASGSANGNSVFIWALHDFTIIGNMFEDNRGTQLVGYHVYINDSTSGGVITGNLFPTGKPVNGFFAWNGDGHLIDIFANTGYNPVGKLADPFYTAGPVMGLGAAEGGGSAVASPVASTAYVVCGGDVIVTSTGGTSVSITIKDTAGNTLNSALTTLTRAYIKRGSSINWGAFTGTVTATVEAV